MTSHNGRSGNGSGDLESLRAEIRQTRAELGQTIQALAAKTDVKTRLRLGAARTGQRVRDRANRTGADLRRIDPRRVDLQRVDPRRIDLRRTLPVLVVAGVVVTTAVAWLTMRGRRR
ncbi:DUF3618 domain-containing protein [Solwaraspora sp. WMMB335]|uniref:DUF3618 domain-containing protein n=1 Tax=Solwaraspora sp. WMMB335 TaxID=3404118 RepID=UPI003B955CF9